MKRQRIVAGLVALVGLAAGLNLLVLEQDFFSWSVLLVFGVAAVSGGAWVVMVLAGVMTRSQQEGASLYGLNTVVSAALFLGICMVIYAFSEHWDRSWDLTKEGRRRLAGQTVRVLEAVNQEVSVICFFLQIDDQLVRIARDKTERFLRQCQGHTPLLKVEFLDPQIDRGELEAMNITHASTQGTVVLRCGARQRVITLGGASPRLEEREFTNGLINVLRDAQPKVCFLTGHGERDILDGDEKDGATMLKALLEGESYQIERIAIRITDPEIPTDCSILVINGLGLKGPQGDLHPKEIEVIQAYLDQGGRMLILLDPWLRTSQAEHRAEQLRPWLERRYGILVGSDVLISPTAKWSAELSPEPGEFEDKGPESLFRGSFNMSHRVTRMFDQKMLLSVVRTVQKAPEAPDNVVCAELLRTPPDFWAETDVALLAKTGRATRDPQEEPSGPHSVAVAVTAKTDVPVGDGGLTRDARLVVVGDTDFASNGQLGVIPGNLNFIMNAIAWLSENEELIAIRPTGKEDMPIMLSDGEERAIVWISVLGTLQAVAAAGLAAYVLRRKYQ